MKNFTDFKTLDPNEMEGVVENLSGISHSGLFFSEKLENDMPEIGTEEYFDMMDCWDAIGGDWEG